MVYGGIKMKYNQKRNRKNRRRCFLPPYKIETTMSIAQAGDAPGWQITAFNLPDAWEHTKGKGVTIAVLDTGCDLDHPDIAANLVVKRGANILNPSKPPADDNAHGTHCCGIIAAPKNDLGIIGVAPQATIMPVKVLDRNGSGDLNAVTKGIYFAIRNKVDIISMSLGAPFPVQNLHNAIRLATKKGIPVFCAAGNSGLTKNVFYPARYPETIAIGSIDENFKRSSFSNTGQNLDFMAPGGKILSAIPDDWYGVMSGTSMACPFAVGVTALLMSYVKKHKPGAKLDTVRAIRSVLRKHTTPISDKDYAGKKFFQGFGIIDPRSFQEYLKSKKKRKRK